MANSFGRHILSLSQSLPLLVVGALSLAIAAGCAAPRAASADAHRPGSGTIGHAAAPVGTIGHAAAKAPVAVQAQTPFQAQTPVQAQTNPNKTGIVAATTPAITAAMLALKQYSYVDPEHLIDRSLLDTALVYFGANKSTFTNQGYIAIIDYAKPSSQHRLFIINMRSGQVWGLPVAHGQGSDPARRGLAKFFSDLFGSNASSLGFFRTAETYDGYNGLSLKLDGLSPSNTNARRRNVVIHGANYVKDGRPIQGRSWGCPAVPMADRDHVITYLKNGSLLYAGLGSKTSCKTNSGTIGHQ